MGSGNHANTPPLFLGALRLNLTKSSLLETLLLFFCLVGRPKIGFRGL